VNALWLLLLSGVALWARELPRALNYLGLVIGVAGILGVLLTSLSLMAVVYWLAMSWVAIVGQVVHFSLPPGCYAINTFERSGHLYERLGVRLFKQLVRRGPLALLSPTLRFPKDRTPTALRHLDDEMRNAETGHVYVFVLMLVCVSAALLQGWFDAAGWMALFNLIINGYPIMLQRYNRIKLQELIVQQLVVPGLSEGLLR
jgi:hypothetical protein